MSGAECVVEQWVERQCVLVLSPRDAAKCSGSSEQQVFIEIKYPSRYWRHRSKNNIIACSHGTYILEGAGK